MLLPDAHLRWWLVVDEGMLKEIFSTHPTLMVASRANIVGAR
jgi:hypothetical protein